MASIRSAFQRSASAQAFADTLQEHRISLAVVTRDEAYKSRREAAFAREIGRYAPAYRDGEIVAVTSSAQVYRLSRRTTGEGWRKVEKFLKPLDRSRLRSIEKTRRLALEGPDLPPQKNRGVAAFIAERFAASSVFTEREVLNSMFLSKVLNDRGIRFAVVTKMESESSIAAAARARAEGRYLPRYASGEIVAITTPSRSNARFVHRFDQTLAADALRRLRIDRRDLHGIGQTARIERLRAWERRREPQEKPSGILRKAITALFRKVKRALTRKSEPAPRPSRRKRKGEGQIAGLFRMLARAILLPMVRSIFDVSNFTFHPRPDPDNWQHIYRRQFGHRNHAAGPNTTNRSANGGNCLFPRF